MNKNTYKNFDILIERYGDSYRARVLDSPSGQGAAHIFRLPFTDEQLEILLLRIGRRRGMRGAPPSSNVAAIEFGGSLYSAVFQEQVRAHLLMSLQSTEEEQSGLRIRIRLSNCPELADLPWEYLYDSERRRFICLSTRTPMVRFLELPEPSRVLSVTGPLRMLVVISNPNEPDFDELDVEREWANLEEALSAVVESGHVEIDRLDPPTLSRLDAQLRHRDYHILHFIGHGRFSPQVGYGELLFEDDSHRGLPVGAAQLATLLHDHGSLRLALLNACEGARTGHVDPLAGVAQTLVQQRIPAVVAMQFEISDHAAIAFSKVFYEMLAVGDPIDTCIAHARRAIYAIPNPVEWATPVLYLRAGDGQVFDVSSAPERIHSDAPPRKAPAAESPWRATVSTEKRSSMVRATIINVTLTSESHIIVVRWGWSDSLEVDGRIITKSMNDLNGDHTFVLTDGDRRLAAELTIKSKGMRYIVQSLVIDGQSLSWSD
ncbi:CHAT domain-containing protein [Nonomuraea guangzhouensis]|uniref:CHAT domain-containing protein n=1 Tax=Nonomuraea guangzhouensis TaxID=1291555 RepID=A0ABW4GGA3_9ACTN|nr:CHAT domain-containing protein [Nonomuraea guangzhouensis]